MHKQIITWRYLSRIKKTCTARKKNWRRTVQNAIGYNPGLLASPSANGLPFKLGHRVVASFGIPWPCGTSENSFGSVLQKYFHWLERKTIGQNKKIGISFFCKTETWWRQKPPEASAPLEKYLKLSTEGFKTGIQTWDLSFLSHGYSTNLKLQPLVAIQG